MENRTVFKVINATRKEEGACFIVHRPFPSKDLLDLDPFLMLDEMGPVDLAPGDGNKASEHPHRGFETVTYMLSGQFEHRDSQGNGGRLNPGDVQWITAGAGIVHSEMPSPDFLQRGGRLHGFQLWVNLPKQDKMMRPHYQEVPASRIPTASADDGRVTVRVIAGEAMGKRSVIETRTPITFLHFKLKAGARLDQPFAHGHNAFAYVISGRGTFDGGQTEGRTGQAIVYHGAGAGAEISALEDLDFLLIAGRPLLEPIVRHGPFIMNTNDEVHQAFDDYHSGKMAQIVPEVFTPARPEDVLTA